MTIHTKMDHFIVRRSRDLEMTPDQYIHALVMRDIQRLSPPKGNHPDHPAIGPPIDVFRKDGVG